MPLLARAFLRRFAEQNGEGACAGFSPAALAALERYAWPGNVRELHARASSAPVILTRGEAIDVGDLPEAVRAAAAPAPAPRRAAPRRRSPCRSGRRWRRSSGS